MLSLCLWTHFIFYIMVCASNDERSFSAGARAVEVASVPVLQGLSAELVEEFPEEPPSAVAGALLAALRMAIADEGLSPQDFECDRDYSQACPQGWIDMG